MSANFEFKSTIVGVDVEGSGENSYTLSLVTLRDSYAAPKPETRFFQITNGKSKPTLNNDVMYVGAVQIRTYHSSFIGGTLSNHVDTGQTITLHVFEESIS